MSGQIKVGVIGTGFFSKYHYDGWSRIPQARLVAACTHTNRARLEQLAVKYSIAEVFMDAEEMFAESALDLVDIVTTPETHAHLVGLAVKYNVHAICQKPLATSYEEARHVARLSDGKETIVAVHENWRFKPWFREVKRLLLSDTIGTIYSVAFRLRPGDGQGADAYLDRQPYFQRMPRFLIHETGIHMVDVFRFLFGEVRGVFARLYRLNPHISGEDAGHVIFSFGSVSGLFDGNRLAGFDAADRRLTMGELLIEGSNGSIRLDGSGTLWVRRTGAAESKHPYAWENRGYSGDCVYALQSHVISHLTRATELENSAVDYLRNLAVEEAIYRSNEEGRWVEL